MVKIQNSTASGYESTMYIGRVYCIIGKRDNEYSIQPGVCQKAIPVRMVLKWLPRFFVSKNERRPNFI
jgi:hypothetical protein